MVLSRCCYNDQGSATPLGDYVTPAIALLVLAWVAIVLLALALGGVVAQLRSLHAVVTSRPVPGGRAPVVGELVDNDGNNVSPPYSALFVTGDCATCQKVVPAIVRAAFDRIDKSVPVFVVSDRPVSPEGSAVVSAVHWIVERTAAERFGIPAFPWLVSVDGDGEIIDHQVAHSPNAIAERILTISQTMSPKEGATK